jgi:hypothetical protein
MKTITVILALTVTVGFGAATLLHAADSKPVAKLDTKPGPAYQMVQGKVTKIDGDFYVVEDYEGKEVRIYVSKDTKKMKGPKKPGDSIRAEITMGGHANSIQ